jgi:hypothetical protein
MLTQAFGTESKGCTSKGLKTAKSLIKNDPHSGRLSTSKGDQHDEKFMRSSV